MATSKPLTETDMIELTSLLVGRSCTPAQAQALQAVIRAAYERTMLSKRASFKRGDKVRVDFRGETTFGTIVRVSRKTVTIETSKGLMRATHGLVTVVG